MNTNFFKKYTLVFASMMIFSLQLSASELFEDVIFHIDSNTKNATDPSAGCDDYRPQNFTVTIGANGRAVVNSADFSAASNYPDCDFNFSNDGVAVEPELEYVQPGIKDAYFHVLTGWGLATPVGSCPFEINVLPLRRRMEWKKGRM